MTSMFNGEPFAHTYSIAAFDDDEGTMGAAVHSNWFSVGSVVPWARSGAGVVVTQSFTDISYGPRGLDLMGSGLMSGEALSALIAEDEHRDVRQVAMVDVRGNVAAYTGSGCIAESGHIIGPDFSVQANMMLRPTVPEAMADAFQGAKGRLAERMLAALQAAEGEGGDIRGRRSACLLVVRKASTGRSWEGRVTDLRVEDSSNPLADLSRLLRAHRAYERLAAGNAALAMGDLEKALKEYSAAEASYPENEELSFWTAVSLANHGWIDASLERFALTFERNERWRVFASRLYDKDHIAVGDEDLMRILSA